MDIQAVEDNQWMENIHNLVELGSLVVAEIHQAVLDTLSVAVKSLAVEDIQDIPGLRHIEDIPNTFHTYKLHTIIHKYMSLYVY